MVQIVTAIIAGASALLAPFIAWLLSNRGKASHIKDVEFLLKRVELIERTTALVEKSSDIQANANEIIKLELEDVLNDLRKEKIKPPHTTPSEIKKLTKIRQFLINYPLASVSAGVYRIVFYIFLAVAILGPIASLSFALMEGLADQGVYWIGLIGGTTLYFVISLIFRKVTIVSHNRAIRNAESTTDNMAPNQSFNSDAHKSDLAG